jgi:hypothetical protein
MFLRETLVGRMLTDSLTLADAPNDSSNLLTARACMPASSISSDRAM